MIEPANPQVVYVPQYNPQVVYTQPSTVVIKEEDNNGDAVAAGLIGFTAGIAIGAAIDNDYYYGPYGWDGGFHMYNDAWDDWYDHREDAREDWQDHREDIAEERGDRARDAQEQRTDARRAHATAAERTGRTHVDRSAAHRRTDDDGDAARPRRAPRAAPRRASYRPRRSRGYSQRATSAPPSAAAPSRTRSPATRAASRSAPPAQRGAEQPEQLAQRRRRQPRAGDEDTAMTMTSTSRKMFYVVAVADGAVCDRCGPHRLSPAQDGAHGADFATPEVAVGRAGEGGEVRRPGRRDRDLRIRRASARSTTSDAATARRNQQVFTRRGRRTLAAGGRRAGPEDARHRVTRSGRSRSRS